MQNEWQHFIKSQLPTEESSVTTSPNMISDLTQDFGVLKISGRDASKLLQGQLTCEVEKLPTNSSSLSAFCTPQGRVISLFYLYRDEQIFYLIMPKDTLSLTELALKKYAVFYQVHLADVSAEFVLMGLISKDIITFLPIILKQAIKLVKVSDDQFVLMNAQVGAEECWKNLAAYAQVKTNHAWHQQRICAGQALIYSTTSQQFLPHDLNLIALGAVSFAKGCYTGQEIIARMHYKAKIKKHLYQVSVQTNHAIEPLTDIYYQKDDKRIAVGVVVDRCHEKNNCNILILIEDSYSQNDKLFLNDQPEHFFKWPK